ncbi:hypothetical protein DIC66_07590 [Rhodoferax lacus]|uniref:Uncharacterized protein n=2 Tax=Rhodoferax lacus TaxID=2184758 RepID=A0A3E1REB5_9BURK|nr:hypothetical protein DIC66_07590 [Rhodoferax lacus]
MKFARYWLGVLIAVLMALPGAGHAYDLVLPGCKPVGDWKPVFGKCDANGVLTGTGGALFFNMFVKGQFLDGLPDGKHDFYLGSSTFLSELNKSASSEIANWDALLLKNPRIAEVSGNAPSNKTECPSNTEWGLSNCAAQMGRNTFCTIHFAKGELVAKAIACNLSKPDVNAYGSESLNFTITPFDGKLRIQLYDQQRDPLSARRDKDVMIVADVPTLSITYRKGEGARAKMVARYKGNADSVEIGRNLSIKGFLGDYEEEKFEPKGKLGQTVNSVSQGAEAINGYFNVSCVGLDNCRLDLLLYKPTGASVDNRYLTTHTLDGKKFQYVMTENAGRGAKGMGSLSNGYVYYFKSPDGMEFDGSVGACPGGGKASMKSIGASVSAGTAAYLDIRPVCGKVTAPNGQSFTGKFNDEGKPVLN